MKTVKKNTPPPPAPSKMATLSEEECGYLRSLQMQAKDINSKLEGALNLIVGQRKLQGRWSLQDDCRTLIQLQAPQPMLLPETVPAEE